MLARRAFLAAFLGGAGLPAAELRDIDGARHAALDAGSAKATALFFVLSDCPISNQLAPEIQRIQADYDGQGVRFFLVYLDPDAKPDRIREHRRSFFGDCCPALLDASRELTRKAGATITPEAAVFSPAGKLLYRGRINDLYAALGKKRPAPSVHDLRRALDETLAGKPVRVPRTQAIGCYAPPAVL